MSGVDESMADSEYRLYMDTLVAAARLVQSLPLDRMQRTTEVVDSLGPIIYPSEFRAALHSGNLHAQKALIGAAIGLRDAFEDVLEGTSQPTTDT